MLTKRLFLKNGIIGIGALVVAPWKLLTASKKEPEEELKWKVETGYWQAKDGTRFYLGNEYGRAVSYFKDFNNYKYYIEILKQHANQDLPPNIKYELRVKVPTNFSRDMGIAYYYHPDFQNEPLETLNEAEYCTWKYGYYYFGRFITGA